MFINPNTAIQNGWITGDILYNAVQPNAIDFTLDRLFLVDYIDTFVISEKAKQMRKNTELVAHAVWTQGGDLYWHLKRDEIYDGMSNLFVNIPSGVAAMLIIRSSFSRNGIFMTSGLYDSGFQGQIGFVLHNRGGTALIAPGTRIGQIMFVESDSFGTYAGGWNHAPGTHYSEKK